MTPTVSTKDLKANMRHIHTHIASRHLATRGHHTLAALKRHFPESLVAPLPNSEQINHPFQIIYKVDTNSHLSSLCSLCNTHHPFNCTHIRTTLSALDLWTEPTGVTALLARRTEKLAGVLQAGRSDSPH